MFLSCPAAFLILLKSVRAVSILDLIRRIRLVRLACETKLSSPQCYQCVCVCAARKLPQRTLMLAVSCLIACYYQKGGFVLIIVTALLLVIFTNILMTCDQGTNLRPMKWPPASLQSVTFYSRHSFCTCWGSTRFALPTIEKTRFKRKAFQFHFAEITCQWCRSYDNCQHNNKTYENVVEKREAADSTTKMIKWKGIASRN